MGSTSLFARAEPSVAGEARQASGNSAAQKDPVELLRGSGLFEEWTDPRSGVPSWLLARRVAPVQQSFYFVNASWTNEGRYFWLYTAYPPGGSSNYGRALAVADLAEGVVRACPETLFLDASPMVDPVTAQVYWCTGSEIWRRGPGQADKAERVNVLPQDWVRNRRPWRVATHLTRCADGRSLGVDVEIGREWIVGQAPLDGGPVEAWARFERCYNHAQCSPTDPDLMLVAQDHSTDPVSGELHRYENRLWLVHRNGHAEPIYPENKNSGYRATSKITQGGKVVKRTIRDPRAMHSHEWWNAAGTHVWYVHHGSGVERVSLADRRPELIWKHDTCSHAHADAQERWLVADNQPPDEPLNSRVAFFNRATGREVNIVSFMPKPDEFRPYHIHPHPQFCCDDRLICYTTTVRGRVDVAFASVADLVAATG